MSQVTLLFLNAGRRIELIRAVRNAFEKVGVEGPIITTDLNKLAPALHHNRGSGIYPAALYVRRVSKRIVCCVQTRARGFGRPFDRS